MKKVFINGGARTGEALQRYVRHRRYLQGCEAYLFEPNPGYRVE
jgi:hypothetical protein